MISVYPKAEILFPPRLIPSLKRLRGPEWAELVERVARLPETDLDVLAFCLMMIELDGCLNCYAGSYRFMRGCAACARQTIMQFKGTDRELLHRFESARARMADYLAGKEVVLAIEDEEEPAAEMAKDVESEDKHSRVARRVPADNDEDSLDAEEALTAEVL